MSSFTFNFLLSEETPEDSSNNGNNDIAPPEVIKPFVWTQHLAAKFFQYCSSTLPPHDWIPLSNDPSKHMESLMRIRERCTASSYKGTDLVPGVYEGGDVVWECSLDLCRYLHENQIAIHGSVLELGCGHGLPGCWVLRQAKRADDNATSVFFTDYNDFVLDATIYNITLNTMCGTFNQDWTQEQREGLSQWLSKHAILGSGDWNDLSRQLDESSIVGNARFPQGVPVDGMFDCILAAETTYSTTAAMDTARFITKHLKKESGVAYVATKRYYFGVGGGSDSFQDGLRVFSSTSQNQIDVEILQVYDNGAGNIRELLRVKWIARTDED